MPGQARAIFFACAFALCVFVSRASEVNVFIYDYYFAPTNITIAPGDTVTWINKGSIAHDTTSANGLWGSPLLFNDEEFFSYTFTQAGQYPYFCATHIADYPYQTGLVIVASANLPPSVRITNPAGGAMFLAPASFPISAEAGDTDGFVTNVQFFANGAPVGNSPGPTFTVNANGLAAGDYALTAIATDNSGAATTSDAVSVSVTNPPVKYPLTIGVLPPNSGTVAADPPPPPEGYNAGTVVMLTASANQGFAFNGWSGDAASAQNPLTVTMDAAKNITANFFSNAVPTHTLTLATNPPNGGTIQVAPAPNGPSGTYLDGTVVMLTAVAAIDFAFTNWTGDVSGTSNSITLVIDADKSVAANFFESITPRFTLTLVTNPPGAGTIQASPPPNGTNGTYPQGTMVTLTATAIGTNAFTNWTGAVNSTSNRITVVMDADKSVTANFVPIIPAAYTLTITISPANGGAVLVTPGPNANGTYAAGTTVALAAQPNAGFRFSRWTNAVSSTNNPLLLVMTGNKSVTALFDAITPLNFADLAGAYSGLLLDESGADNSITNYMRSGFVALRVSRTGAYRGTATIGGIREFVAGQFDPFGSAPLVARRATLVGLLQIDSAGLHITGLITDGKRLPPAPVLLLYRHMAPTNPAALTGNYTATFGPVEPVNTESVMMFRLLDNSSVRLHGTLGDGTAFAGRTFLSADGRIPLFAPLYGNRGVLMGWLELTENGTVQGTLRWFRPGNSRNVNYPEGFGLKVPVAGSRSY